MSNHPPRKPHPDPEGDLQQRWLEGIGNAIKWTNHFEHVDDAKESYERTKPKRRNECFWVELGVDVDGNVKSFSLGGDENEAAIRAERLYLLWEDNVRVNGGHVVWSPLAMTFAEQIAVGRSKVLFPPEYVPIESENKIAEYAQMLNVLRDQFPALDILPSDPEMYNEGCRQNEEFVAKTEAEWRAGGVLAPARHIKGRLLKKKISDVNCRPTFRLFKN